MLGGVDVVGVVEGAEVEGLEETGGVTGAVVGVVAGNVEDGGEGAGVWRVVGDEGMVCGREGLLLAGADGDGNGGDDGLQEVGKMDAGGLSADGQGGFVGAHAGAVSAGEDDAEDGGEGHGAGAAVLGEGARWMRTAAYL